MSNVQRWHKTVQQGLHVALSCLSAAYLTTLKLVEPTFMPEGTLGLNALLDVAAIVLLLILQDKL